ncbi:MAG TPA: zinc-binding alcohol dehydrogenase family protein [Thermoplasmata archaeon]|nr:zinc-binding alcohol dehydrogenase family protein [Thermoplasmata archaeon]
MKAMVLRSPAPVGSRPLRLEEVPTPVPGDREVLVRVDTCGVCRTDLHVVEGDLPPRLASVIPGHEAVGTVAQVGRAVRSVTVGETVGIPWLHRTCGRCEYCTTGRENLCDEKVFSGYTVNGGYAPYALGEDGYVLRLPPGDAVRSAPFLCAGIIGYRALKAALSGPGGRIGFFGFGGSAHLTLQLASRLGYATVAYSRSPQHLDLARKLGASETVLTDGSPLHERVPSLDGAVVFAPVGEVVVQALSELKKGATVSIAAIHMSPIPPIDYDRQLFGERRIVSVEANTRSDAREFLALAFRLGLESTAELRPLAEANEALLDLKGGRVVGTLVLDCSAERSA